MKTLLLIPLLFCSVFLQGQKTPNQLLEGKASGMNIFHENTDTPQVIRLKSTNDDIQPAFFLNGEMIDRNVITHIDPELIESIEVKKDSITMSDISSNGAVYITSKSDYIPSLISLNQIREKYVEIEDRPTVFFIDGDTVGGNFDDKILDEKNILKIEYERLQRKGEYDLNVVKIFTRSKNKTDK